MCYNDTMQNFKNYFFATYKIPTEFHHDFNVWSKIPRGEFGVTIYIPGDVSYGKFNITTNVGLYGYNKKDGIKKVSYQFTRFCVNSSPRVSSYYKSDELLFSRLVEENSEYCLNNIESFFLTKKNIFDISLIDFISLTEKEFNQKVKETLTPEFYVFERNKELGLDIPFETTIDVALTEKSVASFHRAFNKTKRYCNPKVNQKYERDFGTMSLESFNKILSGHELSTLKRNLDKELVNKEGTNKRVKI